MMTSIYQGKGRSDVLSHDTKVMSFLDGPYYIV